MMYSKCVRTKLNRLLHLLEQRPWTEEERPSMFCLYNKVLHVWCLAS